MPYFRQRDGLSWLSLFSVQPNEQKKVLDQLRVSLKTYSEKDLPYQLFSGSSSAIFDFNSSEVQTACERVLFKFMLCDTDFAKDYLNGEEFMKANEVYARKQYNSKLLQTLLRAFSDLLSSHPLKSDCYNLFTIPVLDEIRRIREEEINRSFGSLKKRIETVAAGVKGDCYLEGECGEPFPFRSFELDAALNEYLLQGTRYNFNEANHPYVSGDSSTLFCNCKEEKSNGLLQSALLDDAAFWEAHKGFNVVAFLNAIVKQNDLKHAEKILAFIADNLQKKPHMDIVFGHGFPLYASLYDELTDLLEDQAYRFSFKRLEPYCDVSTIKNVRLCYPMCKKDEHALQIGKTVWDRFISSYNYPNDSDAVNRYLKNEVDRFVSGETHDDSDVAVILDAAPFRYYAEHEDRRIFTAYHPDCFSSENVWNRVYLKAYAVALLSSDEQTQFSYLHRLFFDLLRTVEKKTGICTAHQLDLSKRAKHYEKLKQMLAENGVRINDEHKADYVISLLDRDTALMEETALFPVLEQLGDAIYGLAVAELLFYNPDTDRMAEKYEQYTRAEAQVLISKKMGIDKLYLQVGDPAKYVEFDSLYFDQNSLEEERLQELNREKYLADSLEMIIGSVYRDAGIESAITLAKTLLRKTFPGSFPAEILPTEQNRQNDSIDPDYWMTILPAPCSVLTGELRTLWIALDKVVLIASLGTDDKKRRQFITNSIGNTAIYGEKQYGCVSWAFYDYLNNGLSFVLEKYGKVIRENYQSNKLY